MSLYKDVSVLIVDDDRLYREMISDMISDVVPNISKAADGLEGLNIIENNKIDIAIIDINMPKLGGIELLSKINLKSRSTICIMLTGGATKEQMREILKHDAFDFLEKPFEPTIFLHHFKRAILYRKKSRLLHEAAKELLFRSKGMNLESYDQLTDEEQLKILEAGFAIKNLSK